MPKPAFIVEGYQEKSILRRMCPKSHTSLIGMNGDSVEIQQIAAATATKIRIYNNKYYPIFVLFDRERRAETAEDIEGLFLQFLEEEGIQIDQVIVCVVDRKIESWILPFIDKNGEIVAQPQRGHDGEHALGELEKRLKAANASYDKTTLGVKLFCQINPKLLSDISPSFRRLFQSGLDHCRWFSDHIDR